MRAGDSATAQRLKELFHAVDFLAEPLTSGVVQMLVICPSGKAETTNCNFPVRDRSIRLT
jgi:hypothetical protein